MQSVSLHPTHNLKTAHTSKIGSIFKDRRALMSLGEEEVASQTFINIKYIRAIESGDYSAFPARVFALKYYSKYANFLNIRIPFFDLYTMNAHHAQRENKCSSRLLWLSKSETDAL
ncbi:helix-turn-helix domain-containing protein [Gammaproteobacteria bacterium]|nr:helix-turn-helix domain-containing protein [Gammaproteobacteria bacterium]MDA9966239.1 helix-turn-helix domain-containing protein [Gammaproteobacteria bacterium]